MMKASTLFNSLCLFTAIWCIQAHSVTVQTPQEQQSERDASIRRIRIYPSKAIVEQNSSIIFSAVGLDRSGRHVGGATVIWTARDSSNKLTPIGPEGRFTPRNPGVFRVTATDRRGKHQTVAVTVKALQTAGMALSPLAPNNQRTAGESAPPARARNEDSGTGWDESNIGSAFGPKNHRGRSLSYSAFVGVPRAVWEAAENLGSGNFTLPIPILDLRGRGIDVNLTLTYNAHIWNVGDVGLIYDPDFGWPAPGWSLGFGKLVRIAEGATTKLYLLTDSDGTRHMCGVIGTVERPDGSRVHQVRCDDGTLISGTVTIPNRNWGITDAQLKYPNGTVVVYTASGNQGYDNGIYPTQITDVNGNYITVAYRENKGPNIEIITDTLGRNTSFTYDATDHLTAITGPDGNNLIRMHYRDVRLWWSNRLSSVVSIIDALYYPGTSTGYWFADKDSYSDEGVLRKVSQRRGMTFTGPSNEQGTVGPGLATREVVYGSTPGNIELGFREPAETFSYRSMSEWWEGGENSSAAVTHFSVGPCDPTLPNDPLNEMCTKTTSPDNSKILAISKEGQVISLTNYDDHDLTVGVTKFAWEPSIDGPRLKRRDLFDEKNQKRTVEYGFGEKHNQITDVIEYDFLDSNISVLRRTHIDYESDPLYEKNHVFNLTKSVEKYDGKASPTLVSRAEYTYDKQSLGPTPGIIQHSDRYNPEARVWIPEVCHRVCDPTRHPPCQDECEAAHWEGPFDPATDYRGNVTQITRYADAVHRAGGLTQTFRYDIAGNLVAIVGSSCCDEISYAYDRATQYAFPITTIRGGKDLASDRVTTSATYYYYTSLPRSMTDENGARVNLDYSATSSRIEHMYQKMPGSITNFDAEIRYEYDDAAMSITETRVSASGAVGSAVRTRFNGLGMAREIGIRSDSSDAEKWNIQTFSYDSIKRPWKQSRPFASDLSRPRVMFVSARNPSLAVNAWDGAQPHGLLQLHDRCAPDNPDCTWTYDVNRMLVSTRDPGLAINAYNGAHNHGEIRLVDNCTPTNPDCTWTYENGMLLSDRNRRLAIKAAGGARYGAALILADDCTAGNPDCGWSATEQVVAISEKSYDTLGRLVSLKTPDGNNAVFNLYNEKTERPSSASSELGQTVRSMDTWGRERWMRYDALGRVAEVVEPVGSGNGSVFEAGNIATRYSFNAFDQLVEVKRGNQATRFSYDSLGRTIGQRLPEKNATLNGAGKYVGAGGVFSDFFIYDERGNPRARTDARGVKTVWDYGSDPLNRLRSVAYDIGDAANASTIAPTAPVTFSYMASDDKTRLWKAGSGSYSIEYGYDNQGLIGYTKSLFSGFENYPLIVETVNDPLGRVQAVIHPDPYAVGRMKLAIGTEYDIASRTRALKIFRLGILTPIVEASAISYNAESQMTRLNVNPGVSGFVESYEFSLLNGLLSRQRVLSASGASPLDISYGYVHRNKPGVTGRLVDLVNNLNSSVNRQYEYDALGRLAKVTLASGTQEYAYDSNGNRTRSKAFDICVPLPCNGPERPENQDGLDGITYDAGTNRIITAGFAYDDEGNLVRSLRRDGAFQRYIYDAAGRLVEITDDGGSAIEKFTYGIGRQRVAASFRLSSASAWQSKVYVWDNGHVIAEYEPDASTATMKWQKSYLYLGERLLATSSPVLSRWEKITYHQPDRLLGTRLVTDGAGNVVEDQNPYSYGTEPVLSSDNTRRFASYDRGLGSGLDYAVNRFYSSQQGRFIQVDPLAKGAYRFADPQSLNLYAYVRNDPINASDPNGLLCYEVQKSNFEAHVKDPDTGADLGPGGGTWVERVCYPDASGPADPTGGPSGPGGGGGGGGGDVPGGPQAQPFPVAAVPPATQVCSTEAFESIGSNNLAPWVSGGLIPEGGQTITATDSEKIAAGFERVAQYERLKRKYPGYSAEDRLIVNSALSVNFFFRYLNQFSGAFSRSANVYSSTTGYVSFDSAPFGYISLTPVRPPGAPRCPEFFYKK
ncbi:RHS repeat-associated core domain-containing protein [Variovorax sp. J22P240]|uniref:RHS repeat domain-containing protein n=1 Tax=Variovorax sp. J22P240 TaxID=3053514 RepID=UPI0025759A44|nr:RHS repeat domain-containing protein [Variovorax sp. J22P240]MDL9998314.1 RHS repeat-associated core domain-containing protein [Variovorax sp. J22P240]